MCQKPRGVETLPVLCSDLYLLGELILHLYTHIHKHYSQKKKIEKKMYLEYSRFYLNRTVLLDLIMHYMEVKFFKKKASNCIFS